jgi:hypothetical protein
MHVLFWIGVGAIAIGAAILWRYHKKPAAHLEESLYAYLSGGSFILLGCGIIGISFRGL